MKNKIRLALLSAVAFLSLGVLATPAKALNLDEAWMRRLDATNVSAYVGSDSSTCVNFFYVGSSSESVLSVTQTAITAYAPNGTADTTFGTASGAYTLTSTSYDTMGELCDAVDGLTNYVCRLTGCKRDDNSNIMRDQTAIGASTGSLAQPGGYDIRADTGGSQALAFSHMESIGITPQLGKRVNLVQCKVNITTSTLVSVLPVFEVSGKLRKFVGASDGVVRDDTTIVWSEPLSNNTSVTETFNINGVGGIEFAPDAHVVARGWEKNILSTTDNSGHLMSTSNFINCEWEER